MNEPAKDEAELIARMVEEVGKLYVFDPLLISNTVIAAIRASGWAVVPVEPTTEMLWAADRVPAPEFEREDPDYLQLFLFALMRARWAAMLAAAQEVKP